MNLIHALGGKPKNKIKISMVKRWIDRKGMASVDGRLMVVPGFLGGIRSTKLTYIL